MSRKIADLSIKVAVRFAEWQGAASSILLGEQPAASGEYAVKAVAGEFFREFDKTIVLQ